MRIACRSRCFHEVRRAHVVNPQPATCAPGGRARLRAAGTAVLGGEEWHRTYETACRWGLWRWRGAFEGEERGNSVNIEPGAAVWMA